MGTRSSFCLTLATGLFLCSLTTAAAGVSGAYLPTLGPTLIRLKAPSTRLHAVALPPLALEDPAQVVVAESPSGLPEDPVNGASQAPSLSPADAEELEGMPETAATDRPPRTTPADDLLVVTPQMLVDFFKPIPGNGTNAPGASAIVPVNFTPPAINATPSSQAIYRTP